MKPLFAFLLLMAPLALLAQRKKKEKLTPEQLAVNFLRDEQVKRGFDSLYMLPYSLAGKEDGYPELSKQMTVYVTTNAGDKKNFETYASSIRDTLVAINKKYIDILLNVGSKKFKEQVDKRKYTETKTVYGIEYKRKDEEGSLATFVGEIYSPGRPW